MVLIRIRINDADQDPGAFYQSKSGETNMNIDQNHIRIQITSYIIQKIIFMQLDNSYKYIYPTFLSTLFSNPISGEIVLYVLPLKIFCTFLTSLYLTFLNT